MLKRSDQMEVSGSLTPELEGSPRSQSHSVRCQSHSDQDASGTEHPGAKAQDNTQAQPSSEAGCCY